MIAHAVDWDDSRVLEPAGDLRLQDEPRPALRFVSDAGSDLLQSDLAMYLFIKGEKDFAEAAPAMEVENAVAAAGRTFVRSRIVYRGWGIVTVGKGRVRVCVGQSGDLKDRSREGCLDLLAIMRKSARYSWGDGCSPALLRSTISRASS